MTAGFIILQTGVITIKTQLLPSILPGTAETLGKLSHAKSTLHFFVAKWGAFLAQLSYLFSPFSLRFSIHIPARNKKYIGYQRPCNIGISIDKVSNIIQYPYLRYSHVPFNLSRIIPHPATFRRSRCSRSRNCRTCPKRWACRVYQLRWPLGLRHGISRLCYAMLDDRDFLSHVFLLKGNIQCSFFF